MQKEPRMSTSSRNVCGVGNLTFTDAAIDDLRRIGPDAVPKVLKKVLILLDSPDAGYPLGGELTGFRKLVVGRNQPHRLSER